MDRDRAVVRLCAQGMEEEGRGNIQRAADLFAQAWAESRNDFERCIAAHYMARHQPTAQCALRWNQEAIDWADRISDGSADEFFASLYLNLGKSHEDLGNRDRARHFYQCAAEKIMLVSAGAYREIVQDGISRGLLRVGDSAESF